MKAKIIILVSTLVIVGIFVIGISYTNSMKSSSSLSEKTNNIYNNNSFTYGDEDAKVHIVEFFDPACEACSYFYFFLKDIIQKHPNDIKVTLRYAPFHQGSKYVAKILEASREQNKFKDVLEALFKNQSRWASHTTPKLDVIWEFLPNIENFDQSKLTQDMKENKISLLIDKDIADGKVLKVKQTPTFFINGKELTDFGARQLEAMINSEL